eukprot:SAG31_NODE_20340_length_577_cov_1.058577_1_plen_93_part_00
MLMEVFVGGGVALALALVVAALVAALVAEFASVPVAEIATVVAPSRARAFALPPRDRPSVVALQQQSSIAELLHSQHQAIHAECGRVVSWLC